MQQVQETQLSNYPLHHRAQLQYPPTVGHVIVLGLVVQPRKGQTYAQQSRKLYLQQHRCQELKAHAQDYAKQRMQCAEPGNMHVMPATCTTTDTSTGTNLCTVQFQATRQAGCTDMSQVKQLAQYSVSQSAT